MILSKEELNLQIDSDINKQIKLHARPTPQCCEIARVQSWLEIVNPHAAGIDVGSRSHFVATGQGKEDVREFGAYNDAICNRWFCGFVKKE